MGFGVSDLRFRNWGLGFRALVLDFWVGVHVVGFRVYGFGFRMLGCKGLGLGCKGLDVVRAQGLGVCPYLDLFYLGPLNNSIKE